MSVPQTLDGFDVSAAVERMLGEPSLWWQALAIFVGHFADWVALWEASIGDDAKEKKCVHALRGAAANVGAIDLSGHAAVLEEHLLLRLAGKGEAVPGVMRQQLLDSFRITLGVATAALKTDLSDRPR